MTINELFGSIGELLVRIALAFERTFNLVAEGRLGQLVLSDLAIVAVTVFVGLVALAVGYGLLIGLYEELTEPPNRSEDHRDGV